jgi:hypothetical protein
MTNSFSLMYILSDISNYNHHTVLGFPATTPSPSNLKLKENIALLHN